MTRIRNALLLLRGQLWIVPTIISALAIALASYVLSNGAALLTPGDTDIWWLYSGDADSAREVLSSLLSGLITMTSLVVSITFVILTVAASQLGPRLISTFIADRQIQIILGVFLGTILYLLVVLRTLDDELGREAVPHIAVTVGSGLTALCLFALLFYVHKVARSIIADNVVERVASDLQSTIQEILPKREGSSDQTEPPLSLQSAGPVSLGRAGYIQTIDYGALVREARRNSAIFQLEVRAGHFVLRHGAHVRVHPDTAASVSVTSSIRDAFVIGPERTPAQDLEYGVRQLVEIAVRALSPGINDPFTAIAVIDRLAAALEEILSRKLPPKVLRDDDGVVRVLADRTDFKGLLGAAFDLIREAAARHPAILIRMADVLRGLEPMLDDEQRRDEVGRELGKLAETARQGGLAATDLKDVIARIEAARAAVGPSEAASVV
jgi:uncharacterized membrane protein